MTWAWTAVTLNAGRLTCIQVSCHHECRNQEQVWQDSALNKENKNTQDKTKLMKQRQWRWFFQLLQSTHVFCSSSGAISSLVWFSNRVKIQELDGWSFKAHWWKFRGEFESILETNIFPSFSPGHIVTVVLALKKQIAIQWLGWIVLSLANSTSW